MTEEKKKTSTERFELVEVPTQTGIFVQDSISKEVLDDKTVLLRILNTLEEIKKALA